MERKKFIKACCYTAIGIPMFASVLQSCNAIYYASVQNYAGRLVISKSEFWEVKKNERNKRPFVFIKARNLNFPICIYNIKEDNYLATLLKCTHKGCELNVGGGIYSCPCHGSEFSMSGKLLEGPADRDLRTFKTDTDDENIYIFLS